MRYLRVLGLSADGTTVVFVDEAGAQFAAPADERLRAALRSDRARLGQLEIDMDSALRPRDIQARIRAGDSPETVAAVAQVPVEKILPFCVPVLAERQYVADSARRSTVRRAEAPSGSSPTLSDVVGSRLRGRGIDALTASWDAWRRADGRWAVQATYHSGERERTATFLYDPAGRYSVADDDEARWLTGEKQSTSHGPQPREGGERRARPSDPGLLRLAGDSAADWPDDEPTDDLTAVADAVREGGTDPVVAEPMGGETVEVPEPADASAAREPATAVDDSEAAVRTEPVEDSAAAPEPASATADAAATTSRPPRRRRQRRASVPSWDEIMFGKDDDNPG